MEDVPYTDDLDLNAVSTPDDLAGLLRTVHIRADKPSLRALEARTRHSAVPLSKTVVAEMLKGIRFPRKATMVSFLHACGLPDNGTELWQRAWERVAAAEGGGAAFKASEVGYGPGRGSPVELNSSQSVVGSGGMRYPQDDLAADEGLPSVDAAMVRRLEDENKRLRAQLVATRQRADELLQSDDSTNYQRPRSPVVSRRELGTLLRALRMERGMTVERVAESLLCSPDKVKRMESGFRSGTVRDVRDLCGLYQVQAHQRDRLMDLAREAKQQGWWQSYDLPYSDYIGLEAAAVVSKTFFSSVMPGILQTADYARAVHARGVPVLSPEVIEQAVETRLIRQRRLSEANPLRVWSILDEAALHRNIGGSIVMRGQLERLIEAASLPNVTIQVIPFNAGAHPALESNFSILEFAHPVESVVYVEGLIGFIYLNRPKDIERYEMIFDSLSSVACGHDESIARIKSISAILARNNS